MAFQPQRGENTTKILVWLFEPPQSGKQDDLALSVNELTKY